MNESKGIRREIKKATKRIREQIAMTTRDGGQYAAGLAYEGYAGGYYAALQDVLLLLNGVQPSTRNYWDDYGKSAKELKSKTPGWLGASLHDSVE